MVRIRPNELSYADPTAWLEILSIRPLLPKPSCRLFYVPGLVPNMNGVVSHAEHNRLGRILVPGFPLGALRKQENISKIIQPVWLNIFRRRSGMPIMDLLK